jgi:hypothetical protein
MIVFTYTIVCLIFVHRMCMYVYVCLYMSMNVYIYTHTHTLYIAYFCAYVQMYSYIPRIPNSLNMTSTLRMHSTCRNTGACLTDRFRCCSFDAGSKNISLSAAMPSSFSQYLLVQGVISHAGALDYAVIVSLSLSLSLSLLHTYNQTLLSQAHTIAKRYVACAFTRPSNLDTSQATRAVFVFIATTQALI